MPPPPPASEGLGDEWYHRIAISVICSQKLFLFSWATILCSCIPRQTAKPDIWNTNWEQAALGLWNTKFFTYAALKYDHGREYLKDDCLRFRVLSFEKDPANSKSLLHVVDPTPEKALMSISHASMDLPDRVVPYEFTFSSFTDRCENPQLWFSHLFYTRARGYRPRICIKVAPEGNDEGKDTHVSIYVYMRKGEHDDTLTWPFKGVVIIQLLNQLAEECHHEVIMQFTETTPGMCCERLYQWVCVCVSVCSLKL